MHRSFLLAGTLLAMCCGQAGAQTVAFGKPAELTQLSELRGGTDTTVTDMRLHGATTGNAAFDVQTGSNTITDGSLANMTGIPVVIQNTGANVLIQNALILNLQMR